MCLPKILILAIGSGYNHKLNCGIKLHKKLNMDNYYEPIDHKIYRRNNYELIGAIFSYDVTGHTFTFCKNYYRKKNSMIKGINNPRI